MILYMKDWAEQGAYPDYTTKNESAIHLAVAHYRMGIENYAMCLALHDQTLIGVDPHDPNLTLEQKARIAVECKVNFWYFIREVQRAPASSGEEAKMFILNRANFSLYWLFFNHILSFLIMIRQVGKTFGVQVLNNWLTSFGMKNTLINIITKDTTLRQETIELIKSLNDELPPYLKLRTKDDKNNTEEYTVKALGNNVLTHLPQASEKRAANVMRGHTSPITIIDEPPFLVNIGKTLPAALPAGNEARDAARRAKANYGTIFTSTAGRRDSKEGKYIYDTLVSPSAEWSEMYLNCTDEEDLREKLIQNSAGGTDNVVLRYTHSMVGKTDAWLVRAMKDSLVDPTSDEAKMDFYLHWVFGNSSSPLSPKVIKRLNDSKTEPDHVELSEYGYVIKWYVEKEKEMGAMSVPTVASLDTSDAIGRDDIALHVRNVKTGETICTGIYNKTNLTRFSNWLYTWITKYPKLTMIIERRSSGIGIIDHLLELMVHDGINPYKRLYNTAVNAGDGNPAMFNKAMSYDPNTDAHTLDENKQVFGFPTSGSGIHSRTGLYSETLLGACNSTASVTFDIRTVEQLSGLIVKNGKLDHASGSHDDAVIAWLLSYWFLSKANNLNFYGIDENSIFSQLRQPGDEALSEAELARRNRENKLQDRYRLIVTKLFDRLQKSPETLMGMKIENEIRKYEKLIKPRENDGSNYSLAAFKKKLSDRSQFNTMKLRRL